MDKRKFNGGNSTKSKGVDKRKNGFRQVLENAITPEDLSKVVKMLYNKSIKDFDVSAAKLLMEYCLGKAPQEIKQTNYNVDAQELTQEEIKKINDSLNNAY